MLINTILAASLSTLLVPIAHAEDVLIRTAINSDTELVSVRTTSLKHRISEDALPPIRDVVDSVEVRLERANENPIPVWYQSHLSLGRDVDIYGTIGAQASMRLVLYDAMLEDTTAWVLFSQNFRIYLDRVRLGDDGFYRLEKRVRILNQVNSGVNPYLMETGQIFRHDGTLYVGFKTLGSSSALRGRDHPYEFWMIGDQKAVEIEDPEILNSLRDKMASALDDKTRPRMSEQIKLPQSSDSK